MAHVSENNTPINVGRLLETATDPQRLSKRFLRFVLTIVNAKDLVFFFFVRNHNSQFIKKEN